MKFKKLNVSLLSWKLRLNVRVQVFHSNLDSAGEKKKTRTTTRSIGLIFQLQRNKGIYHNFKHTEKGSVTTGVVTLTA